MTHYSSIIDIGLFASPNGALAIASSLSNKQLEILELPYNGFDDVSDIIKHLRNMKSLHTLNLDFNLKTFSNNSREDIADYLATNTTIQNFSLRGWLLSDISF
jgi:hypothetical protein